MKLFHELEKNILVISETEIVQEEIPLLCKFMQNKSVTDKIEVLMLVKYTANTVRNAAIKKKTVKDYVPVPMNKLFKYAVELISNSKTLQKIIIDNIYIGTELMDVLGRAIQCSESSN